MNQKGVFITFMVFLLVASALALYDASQRSDYRQEKKHVTEAAFNRVNNAFNNIYGDVVSLNKEGFAKDVQQRPMPFRYDLNNNSIILTQRVPVRESILDAYIDALNIYSIFANSGQATSDLQISTATLQNSAWDGALDYPDLNYAVQPQCLLYDVNGDNYMILWELADGEKGCVGGFDYADLNIVDIKISINSSGCGTGDLGSWLSGKTDSYMPGETKPYFKITVNEINPQCPGASCIVTAGSSGKEQVYGHFNPETFGGSETDSLTISCDGDWLRVKLGKENAGDTAPIVVLNKNTGRPVDVDLNIVFNQRIELFYFTDFSISVEKKNFPIKRST